MAARPLEQAAGMHQGVQTTAQHLCVPLEEQAVAEPPLKNRHTRGRARRNLRVPDYPATPPVISTTLHPGS